MTYYKTRSPPWNQNYESKGDGIPPTSIKRYFAGRTLEQYAIKSGHKPRSKSRKSESLLSTKYRVHSQYVNQIFLISPTFPITDSKTCPLPLAHVSHIY